MMMKSPALLPFTPLVLASFFLISCEKIMEKEAPPAKDTEPKGQPVAAETQPKSGVSKTPAAPKTPAPAAAPASSTAAAPSPRSEIDALVEKMYPMPQILSLDQITKNWTAVPANAYPQQIVSKVPVPFSLRDTNGSVIGSSNVAPGTPLRPLQISSGQLMVASLADPNMRSQVPIDQTNFKEDITSRYNQFVTRKKQEIDQQRNRARQALLADPSKLAMFKSTGPAGAKDDPRFLPVKASIQRGEAHPASLEEATSFRWNGSERVGGQMRGSYDTVSVHFEVSTIFGKFPTDYKCLLQGGKVVGWIDPITEEKITKP